MANTYNHSLTAFDAANFITTIQTLDVPDANMSGSACGTVPGMAYTMRQGDQVLCKGPDGGLHWYKFDSSRSTPANPVMLFVGP